MAHNNYFQFKQFAVKQDNSAMKVGTDGVLLGAWTSINKVSSVLDIGAGTGIVSLMIAQRTKALINAIEIDEKAFKDVAQNFIDSPWTKRLNVYRTSFQDFLKFNFRKFDCIVCNPPYFSQSVKPNDESRSLARHSETLPFDVLIRGVAKILNREGHFSIIIPVEAERELRYLAANDRLFVSRILRVKPKPSKPVYRVLIEFKFEAYIIEDREISIETEEHHAYAPEFYNLVKDYYLNL